MDLDPAAPQMGAVVQGGAKLVEVNLASTTVDRVYSFNGIAVPPKSYLNDVRVDTIRHIAYISDSELGAILMLDLQSGKTRWVLNQVPETLGKPGILLKVEGNDLHLANGDAFTINCDGIALDPKGDTLYFEAPTNGKLYSIATVDLRDESLNDKALSKRVKFEADIGPTDGFATGPDGALYVTSVEDHSVKRVDTRETPIFTVVANDPRLVWPDSLAWSQNGWLYVTASQILRMPRFNEGQDLAQLPYHLFRCQPFSQRESNPTVSATS
jgi:sugar lactone lactonase YvrE